MFGDRFEDRVEQQKELLASLQLTSLGRVVDLGSGPGYQSIAAALLGATQIYAVDTNQDLLNSLDGRKQEWPITIIQADLRDIEQFVEEEIDTFLCMGDTLTHLPDLASVRALLRSVRERLRPEGVFVITYRDLSEVPSGVDRFIPVRSTADKIMTCFLEHHDESVMVHDLIYIRQGQDWKFLKSAYPKARIPIEELAAIFAETGYTIEHHTERMGLHTLKAVAR